MLTTRFDDALVYVSALHRHQNRKGTAADGVPPVPYVSHLLGVASLVLEAGGDEDEAIAALCHDSVEDQARGGATRREILERFGERVLEIVMACTKEELSGALSDGEKQRRRREVRKHYVDGVRTTTDRSVLRVIAADKLHNARAVLADLQALGDKVWARFNGTPEETLRYYRDVLEALAAAGAEPRLVYELRRVVTDMEALAQSLAAERTR